MKLSPVLCKSLVLLALSFLDAQSQTFAPYSTDATTLHLWHLDETIAPANDAVNGDLPLVGLLNGATLGNKSLQGFGSALKPNTISNIAGLLAATADAEDVLFTHADPTTGAFTYEAVIKLDSGYDPLAQATSERKMQIVSMDNEVNPRIFQFLYVGRTTTAAPKLRFINIGSGLQTLEANIPVTGTNAVNNSDWFHVAVTYDGNAGVSNNIRFFWTKLSGSPTQATSLATGTMTGDLLTGTADFAIGNEARGESSEGFAGLIDEVRISSIARAATDFLFYPTVTATASSFQSGNGPGNTLDNNLATRWSADGDGQSIIYDLGRTLYVPSLKIAFYSGADRVYTFDVLVSTDSSTWTPALSGAHSSGATAALETFALAGSPAARYLKILGHGSTASTLNSYSEVVIQRTTSGPSGDTDQDGLPDAWEILYFNTLAYGPADDPDHDGFTNVVELAAGSNPNSMASIPGDVDGDGLLDSWEMANFNSLSFGANDDPDGDSFNNAAEQAAGTNPNDASSYPGAPPDPSKPDGLMVNLLRYPARTTVPETQPKFSWIFHPAKRGEIQSAYQIIVSSSALLAGAANGDVWSSGQIPSPGSINIAMAGSALTRGSTYYWRVKSWGASATPSSWSDTQAFTIEPTSPPSGARTVYKSSTNGWSGRYQPSFDTSVPPVTVVNKGGGNFFIDFGKDAFGFAKIRLSGNFSGQSMEVRMGENAVGNSVDTAPGATIRYGTSTVALSNGDVTYEVHKASTTTGINISWSGGVMPFRYMELLNCPAPVTAADIRQEMLHYPFDSSAAGFTSSNATLNSVWDLSYHTIEATSFCGVYVDGDRERKPYEADAYINQLGHYGVDREYTLARYSYEYLLDNHTWPLEWRFHFPLMAWADYMYAGNVDALAKNYASIKAYLRTDRERVSDSLLQGWPNNGTADPSDIIDWPSGERDGYVQTSYSSVINAFHYNNLRVMAQIATVLGNSSDVTDFTTRANTIQTSFNSVFWDAANQRYKDGETSAHISAHGNFFPMAMGVVPADRVAAVMSYLKTKRMAPSVYGAQYLLEALFAGDEEDYALGLMADNDPTYKRHWSNMLTAGSTLTMEAWDNTYKSNQDWNHAWGAAPANIIPRFVLGVKPLTPGFGQVEIKPQLGTGVGNSGLTSVSGLVPTIRGPIAVKVQNSATTYKLRVNIPGNMTAKILIPKKGFPNPVLLYDGKVVAAATLGGRLMLDNVSSGEHAVWLSSSATPTAAVLKENWLVAMFGDNATNPAVAGDSMDPDNDGQTNENEFLANTNPLDSADRFAVEVIHFEQPYATFQVTIPGTAGRRYVLERTLSLAAPLWTAVDSSAPSQETDHLTLSDTSPPIPSAFFRVRVGLP